MSLAARWLRLVLLYLILSTPGIAAAAVSDWIDDATERLESLRSRAIADANLAAEQRITQIDLALQNLVLMLSDELNEQIEEVDANVRNYMNEIERMLRNSLRDVDDVAKRLELLTDTSIADICSRIPLCEESYSIREITPTTLDPSVIGSPRLTITGSALGRNQATYEVRYNGRQLPAEAVYRGSTAHTLQVELPREWLEFRPATVERGRLSVTVAQPQPWWRFWRDEVITHVDVPVFLLPTVPIKAELIEVYTDKEWVPCEQCIIDYVDSTKRRRISNHSIPLAAEYRLKRVVDWPEPYVGVAGNDHYFFVCSRPRERETTNGREIRSACFDAAVNRSCANDAYVHYNKLKESYSDEEADALIYKEYRCFAIPATDRLVTFRVELEKSQDTTLRRAITVRDRSKDADGHFELGFGPQRSEALRAANSGFELRVYPTIGTSARDGVSLSRLYPTHTFGNFVSISAQMGMDGPEPVVLITVRDSRE